MLNQLLFLLFINPGFPESDKQYGSGISEVEHSYQSDRPETVYPMLSIDFMVQDSFYNTLKPGFYSVDVSPDLKTILILEGSRTVAKCPVIQVIELDQEISVPSVKVAFVKDNFVYIIYKKDKLEVQGILYKISY